MQARISLSLCYVGILAAIFALYFSTKVFEDVLGKELKNSLRQETHLIEAAYNPNDVANLKKFARDSIRITLISKEGVVLFESDHELGRMGNHLKRPEVVSAFEKGVGEETRYSVTVGVNIYYFAKKLEDGNVLRLSVRQACLQNTILKTTPYLLGLVAVIIVVSMLIAVGLGRAFVRPIKKLSEKLDDGDILDDDSMYKEIAPFVKTIRNKNRELEITIEKLHDEEQKISRMKDEFTANAAHELKTPLTTISGYAEMIETGLAKPEDVPGFATKIHREAKRMLAIANDIMSLSELDKPEKHTIKLDEPVNLLEVASDCIGLLSLNARKKKIELALEGECPSEIKGNRRLIFEMIYNLVDNAIRYTNENGKVVVSVSEKSVSVNDNGIGIPEECQERVFERFFRVDKSHSRETGGTGLGLAIVKHVAQVHDAQINMKSVVGVGTEIAVRFL